MVDIITGKYGELELWTDYRFKKSYKQVATECVVSVVGNEEQQLELDEDFKIQKEMPNGTVKTIFSGKIVNIPSSDDGNVNIKARSDYCRLFEIDTNGRAFKNTDSGEIKRKLLTQDYERNDEINVYSGTEGIDTAITVNRISSSNSTFNEPVAYNTHFKPRLIEEIGLASEYTNVGTELYTLGLREEVVDIIDFENITDNTSKTIFDDGDLDALRFRALFNNPNEEFVFRLAYKDPNGNVYRFGNISPNNYYDNVFSISETIDNSKRFFVNNKYQNGFTRLEDSSKNDVFRLMIKGDSLSNRAIGIDGISLYTSNISNNPNRLDLNPITTNNIPNTGRKISRQFTESVSEALYELSQEENRNIIITSDGTVKDKKKRGRLSPLKLNRNTPIIDKNINVDKDNIINKVTVFGENLRETSILQESIDKFGLQKKIIRDTSIKNSSEAKAKGKQILNDNAFKKSILNVDILPYQGILDDIEVGDDIRVNLNELYPDNDNLTATDQSFYLESYEVKSDGVISLNLVNNRPKDEIV